ncbi:MAG: hypothetical protein AAFP22_22515, partial [Planctomycetota bacterium]
MQYRTTVPAGFTDLGATGVNDGPIAQFAWTAPYVDGEDDFPLVFTWRHNGEGEAGSQVRANGEILADVTFDHNASSIGDRVVYGEAEHHLHETVGFLGRSAGTLTHRLPVELDTIERFEGACVYNYGLDPLKVLPVTHTYFDEAPPSVLSGGQGVGQGLAEPRGMLAKFDLDGRSAWFAAGSLYGSAVAVGEEGQLFTAGLPADAGTGAPAPMFGAVRDRGDRVESSGEDTWSVDGGPSERLLSGLPRFARDGCGGVLLTRTSTAGFTQTAAIEQYDREGVRRFSRSLDGLTGLPVEEVLPYGERVDDVFLGVCGPESFVALTRRQDPQDRGPVRRYALLGRQRTGATSTRRISNFVTTEGGEVARIEVGEGFDWEPQPGGTLRGPRPYAIDVYPFTLFGDGGQNYYVY